MRLSNITLATALAVSAFGCIGEGPEPTRCEERGMECTGDTVCGETECEPAFDRAYNVHVSAFRTDIGQCASSTDCTTAPVTAVPVTVLFNAAPIMRVVDEQDAEIDVIRGSALIVDFGSAQCAVELTAERLRSGHGICNGTDIGVSMVLDPMPL